MKCLVTAIGSMSAEIVVKRLLQIPDMQVVGCNMHPASWTPTSRFVETYYQVPPASEGSAYVSQVLDICRLEKISYVIVLTDSEIDVLAGCHSLFLSVGSILCISKESVLTKARDKLEIFRIFSEHKKIKPIATFDFEEADFESFSDLIIAKPRRGRSSEKHAQIATLQEFDFWKECLSDKNYIVQPFYNGCVIVVDIVRQPMDQTFAVLVRQELLRTSNGAGMTVRMLPGHICGDLALEVANELNLQGCTNIEFLVVDGVPMLMDVNPRFSAGVVFSFLAGYDMIVNHLNCFSGNSVRPCNVYDDVIYSRAYIEYAL